jgi:hypothetical protein
MGMLVVRSIVFGSGTGLLCYFTGKKLYHNLNINKQEKGL